MDFTRKKIIELNGVIRELKEQLKTTTDDRDALKNQASSVVFQESSDSKALQDRISALEQEKLSLEASLNEVRAKATELSNQTATLVGE